MPHVGSLRWLGHIQVRAPVMGRWVGPGVCPSLFRPAPGRRQPESHWGRTGLLLTPDPTSSCSWARKDRAVSGLSTPHYTLLNLSCPYLPPQPTRLHYPKEQFSILAAIRITWEALQKKKNKQIPGHTANQATQNLEGRLPGNQGWQPPFSNLNAHKNFLGIMLKHTQAAAQVWGGAWDSASHKGSQLLLPVQRPFFELQDSRIKSKLYDSRYVWSNSSISAFPSLATAQLICPKIRTAPQIVSLLLPVHLLLLLVEKPFP